MRKGLTVILTIALCLGLLAGCCLSHDWKNATCENPKTCRDCGKTEGEAAGHEWEDATCEEPETCEKCDETRGRTLDHVWEGENCALCGMVKDTVTSRNSYTDEDNALKKNADTVVAAMGDQELTNGELMVYYYHEVNTFCTQYSGYLPYLGLDPALPLDQQIYEDGLTWEQYFLEAALKTWQDCAASVIMAEEDGFDPFRDAEEQEAQTVAQLELMAQVYGFEDVEDYLEDVIGPGVTEEAYLRCNAFHTAQNAYYRYFYETNQPGEAEIRAYAQENAQSLAEIGITEDMGLASTVRHILIAPEGGTTDGYETTYSHEAWKAAEEKTEMILRLWQEGNATEESFAELAAVHTDDPGSAETGGLFENVCDDGTFVEPFAKWATDPNRRPGDTGIIQTDYGYHIMYYVEGRDYYTYAVGQAMLEAWFLQRLEQTKLDNPLNTDYRRIMLREMIIGG